MKNLSFLFILLLLFCFSCTQNDQDDALSLIAIGGIYNLTGDQASLDIPSAKGAQLAVQQANDNGGIQNQRLALLLKDGQTNPDTLKAKVAEVLEEAPSTVAFFGLSDTDQVLAAADEASDNNRVFVTSGATSPLLPGQIPDYLFLACFGDNVQAAAAAEYAYETLGAKTVAVIYDSSETYTSLLHGYFIDRFEELGGKILSNNAFSKSNMTPAIQATREADFIFLSVLPQDVLPGIELIRQAGFNVPIVGGDSYDSPDIWKDQSQLGAVYFTTHAYLGADNPNPQVQSFRQAYLQAYGGEEPNAFAALGYDAANLLIQAIEQSGDLSPNAIREALSNIQNYSGVTGTISFGPNSRIPNKSVTIMEVNSGVQELVMEVMPKHIPQP